MASPPARFFDAGGPRGKRRGGVDRTPGAHYNYNADCGGEKTRAKRTASQNRAKEFMYMKVSIFLAHLSELAEQKKCSLTAAVKEAGKSGIEYAEVDYKSAAGREDEVKALLKNAGMSLEDVSVLLSHESTDVTKKYYIKEDTARISTIKRSYNI